LQFGEDPPEVSYELFDFSSVLQWKFVVNFLFARYTLYEYVIYRSTLNNEELHNLYSSPSIIRTIKSRRMRWAGM
jgi:hypothetical protein